MAETVVEARRSERGFVLPLLLLAIALLGLSILSAAEVLDGSRVRLERLRQESRAELTGASVEARVAYLLLTEPISQRGLRVGGDRLDASGILVAPTLSGLRSAGGHEVREMVFDGRAYGLTSSRGRYLVEVEIQDEGGLLNLNGGDEAAIERLLGEIGMRGREAAYLAATLSDFVDGDDIRRLQGAEARHYRSAGRPEPRNAPLRGPRVALAALGWSESLSPSQTRRFFALAAASPVSQRLNLNTAPAEVLAAVLGIERRTVERIVSARDNMALQSLADISAMTGVHLAGGVTSVTGLPSRNLQLTIRVRDLLTGRAGYEYQKRLLIGPRDGDRPLVLRPASSLRRVARADMPQQGWTQFPDLPHRRSALRSRLRQSP